MTVPHSMRSISGMVTGIRLSPGGHACRGPARRRGVAVARPATTLRTARPVGCDRRRLPADRLRPGRRAAGGNSFIRALETYLTLPGTPVDLVILHASLEDAPSLRHSVRAVLAGGALHRIEPGQAQAAVTFPPPAGHPPCDQARASVLHPDFRHHRDLIMKEIIGRSLGLWA